MIEEAQNRFSSIYSLKENEMIAMHVRIGRAEQASDRSSRVEPKMIN
jgi:hypothetical protein